MEGDFIRATDRNTMAFIFTALEPDSRITITLAQHATVSSKKKTKKTEKRHTA
jgi:hypothetical protein